MTRSLEQAISRAKALPSDVQDRIAETVLWMAEHERSQSVVLSESDKKAIEEGLAELDRGEFVSEAEMEGIWVRYRA